MEYPIYSLMDNKKLFFILEEFNPSGGLKIVTAIANTLAEAEYQITILVPKYTKASFYELNDTIHVMPLGKSSFGGKIFYFMRLFVFVRKLDAIVVTPNYRIAALCGSNSKIKSDPLVFLIQGDDEISLIMNSPSNKLVKWGNHILFKKSQTIFAKRIFVSSFLQNRSTKKGQLIPNFISDFFINSPKRDLFKETEITIGTVSTSSPNKGFDLFLLIIDELLAKDRLGNKKFKFICATQDQALIHSNYRHQIDFVSPKNEQEMSAFYQCCDIYLSCSKSEGFNLPVLESMATGCIVFTTNDGGVADLIEDGKDGFLIDTRDEKVISNKISQQLSTLDQLQKVQENCLLKSKQYTRAKFNAAYLQFFMK